MEEDNRSYCNCGKEELTHVHEFLGSTKLAELEEDPHNHRFAGVSDEVIPVGNNHVHEIFTRTDFYEDHFHKICIRTGLAIFVGNGKHVHFVDGTTTEAEDHVHDFVFATLIQDPIGD
ncbi:YmaF family protein [Sporomusa sp.]|uniref:YmaF family protein n=1 Tax=Sporomusa sp. TaxID=2078658 RepID=UPI002B7CAC71|nr:YmaF family protein [Sporomusa sp.]HWR09231.1 YmaF family protein [Sporomusa sp.]